ncbi:MAG: EmrB/QacA family drug resistance transporter [Porticoccaceae bacterium]|nr:EmrB/QacA family drug resistance transporter [Porticoccaceae bacterium]
MSDAAVAPIPARAQPRADLSAWLAVAAGTLGAFMATLDISIVNASLPTIQGEIGATPSEGTWIGTAYLVSEIVAIPLTGWFSRMLGLRRFLLIAAGMFTLFSVLCGLADDLTTMIAGRIGQGVAGGTLIPTALTIIATRLPPRQQPVGIAIFGLTVLLGPVSGPLLGGWITEQFAWNFAFFINVPICLGLMLLLFLGLPPARGDLGEWTNADWAGVFGMVIGLGALTLLLEEGHRQQWFESRLIWQLLWATVIGFALIAWGQFRSTRPVVRLSLLRERSLAATVGMMLLMGALLFGIGYLIPQFLAMIADYNALQAGQIAFIAGIPACMMMPILPTLIARVDLRINVAVGTLVVAISCWAASQMTAQSVGSAFVLTQLLLGAGISTATFCLNQAAISAVTPEDAGDASALFMAARNLGGSVGLATIASLQEQRSEVHRWQIHASLDGNDLQVQSRVEELATVLGGGPEGLTGALRLLDAQVLVDAWVMTFNDIFFLLALGTLAVLPCVLFLKPLKAVDTTAVH